MFHDIRNPEDTKYSERYNLKSFLNEKQFEHQIDVISSKYKVIRSDELFDIDINGNTDYATLTFDDGLSDHFYVYKHLKSKNISGTFLVPTIPIKDHKVMNTHKIQFILASFDNSLLTEEILSNFSNKEEIWLEYSKTKWKNNWWSKEMIFITNFLRRHNIDFDNFEYTDELFKKYITGDEEQFAKEFYLKTSEIEEMSNNNMIIGGHGNVSENLLLIDDVENDISESFNFIKDYSNDFIFSYPNGGYDDNIKGIMEKFNCKLSYTVNPMTITDLDKIDYLEFPRYDSPQKIELK
jgi:hypothetical protein